MIAWKVPPMALPDCLAGMAVARVHCEGHDQIGHATHAELLPVAGDGWTRIAGDTHARIVAQTDWTLYRRPLPWAVRLAVVDGFGSSWDCPALLSPDGMPVCDRSWILAEDGTWQRRSISDAQDRALAAAQAAWPLVHADGDIPPESLLPWACAIIESCYYLDAITIGRLGILTTTAALAIVRGAAGWVPPEP